MDGRPGPRGEHLSGGVTSVASQARRILAAANFLNDITEWDWPEAPTRRLFYSADNPRLPQPLPRFLPPDADRRLPQELTASTNRLAADVLLLQRACGLRIGEFLDLELDAVIDVPRSGSWLKVPLGKFDTERMVPIDDDIVALFDTTIRAEYERSLDLAKTRIGALPPRSSTPRAEPDALDWRTTETIKTALAGGYCLRAPVQGSCQYANICEHCPRFHTTSSHTAVLTQQRQAATALAEDATGRGWDSETERHLKLINRINELITVADARGQAM